MSQQLSSHLHCKRKSHHPNYRFPFSLRKCSKKWPSFWDKHEKKNVVKLAHAHYDGRHPRSSRVFAQRCYRCAACVFEFASVCQQYLQTAACIVEIPLTVDIYFLFPPSKIKLKQCLWQRCFISLSTWRKMTLQWEFMRCLGIKKKSSNEKRYTKNCTQGWCTGTFLFSNSIWYLSPELS